MGDDEGTRLALAARWTPRGSEQEGAALTYHTNVGPLSGPLPSRAGYLAIRVLQGRETRTPIGVALVAGQLEDGVALWRLTIDEAELPGLYVVIDREFWRAG